MSRQENKKATLDEQIALLHAWIGKAVWGVQSLEEALNHFLAMHNTGRHERERADKRLKKIRKRYTLGASIEEIKKKDVLSSALVSQLENFLDERNWLVHRSYLENIDELEVGKDPSTVIERIMRIASQAQELSAAVEVSMMKYCALKGMSLENVKKQLVEKYGPDKVKELWELEV